MSEASASSARYGNLQDYARFHSRYTSALGLSAVHIFYRRLCDEGAKRIPIGESLAKRWVMTASTQPWPPKGKPFLSVFKACEQLLLKQLFWDDARLHTGIFFKPLPKIASIYDVVLRICSSEHALLKASLCFSSCPA